MSLFSELNNVRVGLTALADRFAATVATDIFNTKLYGWLAFIVNRAAGATGTSTFTVEACSDVSATGAVAIPFKYRTHGETAAQGAVTQATAAGFTVAAGADKLVIIEVDPADCPDGKPYVRLVAVEVVDSPVTGAVLVVMSAPRYAATLDAAIT